MAFDDDKPEGFTDRMELFCHEYLVDLNATQAAIRAHYSPDTAKQIGTENLSKPAIKARIKALREEMAKGYNLTKERIAQEYARIGFFDIRKIYDDDGELIPITKLDDDSAAAIAGIEVANDWDRDNDGKAIIVGQIKKIKIADKKAALDSLARLMGYNEPDKMQLTGVKINVTDKPTDE
jgi:phage terminase small subunit